MTGETENLPSHKEAYHQLYKAVDKKDDAISKRYDRLGGYRYLETVAAILRDGYISKDDIKDFSEETKAAIETWIQFLEPGMKVR